MKKILRLADLPDEEEIQQLIDTCWCNRDKAIISVLTQTGFRISELLSMRIRDVEIAFDKASLSCPESKTVPRTIDIYHTVYLETWMRELEESDFKDLKMFRSCVAFPFLPITLAFSYITGYPLSSLGPAFPVSLVPLPYLTFKSKKRV